MDLQKLALSLHPLERKVLPHLKLPTTLSHLLSQTGLQEVEVTRALQWLQNKKAVTLAKEVLQQVALDVNGHIYLREKLPEQRFLEAIEEGMTLDAIRSKARLDPEEMQASLGLLKKHGLIHLLPEMRIELTEKGRHTQGQKTPAQDFLNRLPLNLAALTPEQHALFEELKRRRQIIKVDLQRDLRVELTLLGKNLAKQRIDANLIDALTPAMLREGTWKDKPFRRFDVSINVPAIHPAKKQPYRRFLDEVRQKFLALGFAEMTGPLVETDFWNMDALFMPQFHAARDIHDAYYIKAPERGHVDPALVKKVQDVHETGGGTGSKGWRYPFDTSRTLRHLLRTQGTALSIRTLASPDLRIPGKYFAIARCFRYDLIDATHLADFNQVEGIVIEPKLTLRHLFGLLTLFAKEIAGAEEVKIVPGYFPFTEPSATLYAKHPQMGWIELGGSGIFRPEVTAPFGIKEPVIAWGVGIDRIAMFKFGLTDIRELFSHNLSFLRTVTA